MVKTKTLPPFHHFFEGMLILFCCVFVGVDGVAFQQEIRKFVRDIVRGEPLNSNQIGVVALAIKSTQSAISGPFGSSNLLSAPLTYNLRKFLSMVKISISNGGVESLLCMEVEEWTSCSQLPTVYF